MQNGAFSNIKAKDLMNSEPIVIKSDSTLREAWHVLSQNQISGAPVVNLDREIVGVLSQQDLLRQLFSDRSDNHDKSSYYYSLPALSDSFIPTGEDLHALLEATVEEVMNPYVISVSPEDALPAIAAIMRSNHIHRVIVAEKKVVVGILSTFDLLALVANQ